MEPTGCHPKWDKTIYDRGFALGYKHAGIGDVNDHSDARCKPMEAESRALENEYAHVQYGRAAIIGGYEDGYLTRMIKEGTDFNA